jgi:hypothetical protein
VTVQQRPVITAAALLTIVLSAAAARGTVCGDVDESGAITTKDALAVLRRAVSLPDHGLKCDSCVEPTTTSSTCCYDECFNDGDCQVAGYPPGWVCGGENNAFCVECRGSCPGDNECVNWRCINSCGDFDANGVIAAPDALRVLKRAVGQDVALQCPGCSEEPVTTTLP